MWTWWNVWGYLFSLTEYYYFNTNQKPLTSKLIKILTKSTITNIVYKLKDVGYLRMRVRIFENVEGWKSRPFVELIQCLTYQLKNHKKVVGCFHYNACARCKVDLGLKNTIWTPCMYEGRPISNLPEYEGIVVDIWNSWKCS